MTHVRILGICGSLRARSYNRAALNAAVELAPANVVFDSFTPTDIPLFNQADEDNPLASVLQLKDKVMTADALLFVTPEYNHSVPGVLKNVIDWGSRPPAENVWRGKPAAIMGASPGALGTVRAQEHLRQILWGLNVFVLPQPEVLITNAATRFDDHGNLTDEKTREFVRLLIRNLVDRLKRSVAGPAEGAAR